MYGQYTSKYYPVQFNQFKQSYSIVHPANTCQASTFESNFGYRKLTGSFSSIYTYYASVGFRPKNIDFNKSHSSFGFRFDSDHEGRYIARNRMYAMYAYNTKIKDKVFISAGIDFGFFNMSIKGTPTTGNTSTFIPDANAGFCVWGETYKIGLSLNQLMKGRFQPIKDIIELPTYANLIMAKRIVVSENLSILPSVLIRYPNYDDYNADYSLECIIHPISGGVGYRYKQGIVLFAGINGINVSNGNINIVLSYNAPLANSITNMSNIELGLKYFYGKFDKKKQNKGLLF